MKKLSPFDEGYSSNLACCAIVFLLAFGGRKLVCSFETSGIVIIVAIPILYFTVLFVRVIAEQALVFVQLQGTGENTGYPHWSLLPRILQFKVHTTVIHRTNMDKSQLIWYVFGLRRCPNV